MESSCDWPNPSPRKKERWWSAARGPRLVEPRDLLTWMGILGFTGFISTRGDVMAGTANVKVLFIAGFGPIVRDREESRKLYSDRLGIPFNEEADGYLHTEAAPGAK